MEIDIKRIAIVNKYTFHEYSDWFEVGFYSYYFNDDNFKSFEPLHVYVGLTGDLIGELGEIYDALNPIAKINYRKGLAMAYSGLDENEKYIEIAESMMYLARLINAREMLEPIIQKVGNGFFGYVDGDKKKQIFIKALDVVKRLSDCSIGPNYIKRMIGCQYFSYKYAPMAFIALCRSDPVNYPDHLYLLRYHFNLLHKDINDKANMHITAKRFLSYVDMEIFCEKYFDLHLSDKPGAILVSDNWFAEAMFKGELAPLIIYKISDVYIVAKKEGSASYALKIEDYNNNYEMNNFMEKLVYSIDEQEDIYNSIFNSALELL